MNSKLQQAVTAIKSGDRKLGYQLLIEVIKTEPQSKDAETAWLWMAAIVDEPEKKRKCLETVLAMNPSNTVAKKGLAQLVSPEKPPFDVEMPKVGDIAPVKLQSSTPTFTSAKKSSSNILILLVLFLVAFCVCCAMPLVLAIWSPPETSNPTESSTYSVTLSVSGTANHASVTYGSSEDQRQSTIELPWEYTSVLDYGNAVALVAASADNGYVVCEIWVDGTLRVSSMSSEETDDMAVCGYIVGRNVTIKATE
jgi:hypothetical protein